MLLYFAVVIVLLALGLAGMGLLSASKPELEKRRPTTPAPMVKAVKVKSWKQPVIISGEGTVRPVREINLVPEVGGKVVYVSPALVNGGDFKKGDTLLRIEPVDYQLAVTLAKAKVKSSESLLQLAEQQTEAAKEEWRLHHGDGSETNIPPPPLVAKEPQLAAAKAKLEADHADLKKALLRLERTELKAPFDGRVSQENVDIGQYVSPGQALATLYSTNTAEIMLPLEDDDLFWFHVPGFTPGNSPGSPAKVLASIAGQELSWAGKVVRAEGKLDERTRMINVVVRVDKPYDRKPPLAVGLFVTVYIDGRTLQDAVIIPRSALRQGHVAWVVDGDNRLHFRKVEVARFQGDDVVVQSGLNHGEAVVVSPLKAVTDGMTVRTVVLEEENRS